jgi:hypothetical protein
MELAVILAVLVPVGAAAGAFGGVRDYLGNHGARIINLEHDRDDHNERIKYIERLPNVAKR